MGTLLSGACRPGGKHEKDANSHSAYSEYFTVKWSFVSRAMVHYEYYGTRISTSTLVWHCSLYCMIQIGLITLELS